MRTQYTENFNQYRLIGEQPLCLNDALTLLEHNEPNWAALVVWMMTCKMKDYDKYEVEVENTSEDILNRLNLLGSDLCECQTI